MWISLEGKHTKGLDPPEHCAIVRMSQMCGWIPLLGVNEVWELGGISQEKDGSVVRHHVPITVISPEFHRKPTRVSSAIVRSGFTANCRETDGDRAFLALGAEKVRGRQVVQRICAFEEAMSTTALRMNNSLRNSLPVEMGKEIDQMEVLK